MRKMGIKSPFQARQVVSMTCFPSGTKGKPAWYLVKKEDEPKFGACAGYK